MSSAKAEIRINKKERDQLAPFVSALTSIDIKGLKVRCPVCNEYGYVMTKWIKGPSIKPIVILHFKNDTLKKYCKPDKIQSDNIRRKKFLSEKDIKQILANRKPFVLFSGGKDSVATLAYLIKLSNGANNLTALYIDTTAGLAENTEYIKKVCKYFKVKLKIVRPKVDYFTLVKEWGIPSFKYRWCCRELKIRPIEEYLSRIKGPKVVFDGIRAVESRVRKEYIPIWYHPSFKCLSVSPIFYWSDEEVIAYINSNGIPKTILHSVGSSTECWCGAYKTENDFRKLYDLNKEMFNKLANVEKDIKNRYTYLFKNGNKIPLKELEKRILREKKQLSSASD